MSLDEKSLKFRRRYDIAWHATLLLAVARDDEYREVGYGVGTMIPREFCEDVLALGGKAAHRSLYDNIAHDLREIMMADQSKHRRHIGDPVEIIDSRKLPSIGGKI